MPGQASSYLPIAEDESPTSWAACCVLVTLHVLKELYPPYIQSIHEFFHPLQRSDRMILVGKAVSDFKIWVLGLFVTLPHRTEASAARTDPKTN